MKKLITLFSVLAVFVFTSCSSKQVNDFKIETAEKFGAGVEKELKEAYAGVSIDGVDCNAEAVLIGEKVEAQVLELLKAKQVTEDAGLSQKSLGSVVAPICSFVVSKAIPSLLIDDSDKYACLRVVGSEKLVKVGQDLCEAIDL